MKYLYPGELKHQIFEFAREYGWKKKPCKLVFSEEFIMSELRVDQHSISPIALEIVLKVVDEIVPECNFAHN